MENIEKTEEAKHIIEEIRADRFTLRDHAKRRSEERLLSRENVLRVAGAVIEWKYQEDKFTHWFIGFLSEGRPGGFSAVLDDEGLVRVVTVFKRRLSGRKKEDPMRTEVVESRKGGLSRCRLSGNESIAGVGDFLDLMVNCPTNTVVLNKADLDEAFFDLKSGLAGEILQKVSNYRKRLAVLGDFSGLEGRALGDFIRESNRTGQVIFAADLDAAIEMLR